MQQAIDSVIDAVRMKDNPYFVALREERFDFKDFIETQVQFYHAVTFFQRPLQVLAQRVPDPDSAEALLRNVREEQGEGEPAAAHRATFVQLLERLDQLSEEAILQRALWPELRAFNTTLAGVCASDHYLVGCATLGIIERLFAEISVWIGEGIVQNRWLTRERLVHYTVHADLDIRHAADLFSILLPHWGQTEQEDYQIVQGLELGASAFYTLYGGLYNGRTRRRLRAGTGPHHSLL